ncbi:MAG TPA: serine dehydratase subunit alpha family protein, partial [Candidatus Mediterraneibacter colneyensis]|nr:serine dehydratase subunit alpha family protein [Candidatus Mediterraneibacter colneyensis]
MEKALYDSYAELLKTELIPALGCTEPIALAYAAAKAGEVLGTFPERAEVLCSGNIIKNVKGVIVPNSGGLKGVEAAVVLGLVGGDASRKLEVLEHVDDKDRAETEKLLREGF